ncbi:MAG: WYL domain-containing protein [Bernardetiaceae bacterium]|nr:WYL domain-containing protein [Bernardetiaceae bacterium]
MPITKLALLRYMRIDRMLRNKQFRYPSKQDILEACTEDFGILSVSTIEKDFAAMRLDFDAPIAYHKKEKGYYYTDENYRFLSVNLSEKEKMALGFVETVLSEFRELPIFADFSDAVDKVLDGVSHVKRSGRQPTIHLDTLPPQKGREIMPDIWQYIDNKNVIALIYQKYESETPKTYTAHPYLLKTYRNLWYMIAWVEEYGKVRTFGIDRIISAKVLTDKLYMPPEQADFDAQQYYRYCIGVTALEQQPQDIILSFDAFQGKYIEAQPLHHTQEVLINNKKEYRIKLKLIVNYELKMLLMSYGASLKVMAPEELVADLHKELNKMQHLYASSSGNI